MSIELKSKIIIRNYSSKTDVEVIDCIKEVIKQGRISNYGKNYCYITIFTNAGLLVAAEANKSSDTFIIQDYKGE